MTTYPRLRPLIFQLLQQVFLRVKEGIGNTYFGRNLPRAQRKVFVKRWSRNGINRDSGMRIPSSFGTTDDNLNSEISAFESQTASKAICLSPFHPCH
jgi:hypothetical protein